MGTRGAKTSPVSLRWSNDVILVAVVIVPDLDEFSPKPRFKPGGPSASELGNEMPRGTGTADGARARPKNWWDDSSDEAQFGTWALRMPGPLLSP